jgi:hypothetical protein
MTLFVLRGWPTRQRDWPGDLQNSRQLVAQVHADRLASMGKMSLAVVSIAFAMTALTGCSAPGPAPQPESTAAGVAAISAASIETTDEGIAWARSIDDTVSADELGAGIRAIGDLLPGLDIWFQDSNQIGQALTSLNAAVLAEPDDAATKVNDLNAVVDDIEAAIEKGPNP